MIERIYRAPELSARGIIPQKIRALYQAYGTGYDFCKFYKQAGTTLAFLDGSCVINSDSNTDSEELSDFLAMNGFTDIFCSATVGDAICKNLSADYNTVYAMRFCGEAVSDEITETKSPDEVYSIIKTGFDIDYEPWYLDMSHRIRHGVSRAFRLDRKAALVVQHDINGEALISQVAVVPEYRGRGYASKLLKAVCSTLSPSECFVICEPKLQNFYEKAGFALVADYAVITHKKD